MFCITTIQESKESRKAFFVLKHFTSKLRRVRPELPSTEVDEDLEAAKTIPDDVKEGHFAVVAVKGGKPKRFILDLSFLGNPAFLSLLQEAEEEYGFQQKGPILVPCRPDELQKILEGKKKKKKVASFRGCFFEHGRVQRKFIG